MSDESRRKVIAATAAFIGKRYCTQHRGEAPLEGGEFIQRGKIRRWICGKCAERAKKALRGKITTNRKDI